ncbi:MAG: hypothetical protein WCT85_00760 [Parachlamydiales bacterium]
MKESGGREAGLFVGSGMRGVGKSYQTDLECQSYVMNDPKIARKGRRVLIFDVQMEAVWRKYPTLFFDIENEDEYNRGSEIRKFCNSNPPIIETRRIVPLKKNRQPMTPTEYVSTIRTIANSFSNGLFIAEDLNKYISHKNQDEILDLMISLRHKGIDMYLHLQTLSKLTTNMWENVNWIRFHKQGDTIDRYKSRIPSYAVVKIAEIIVNKKYLENPRFFLFVSPMYEKIKGITRSDFITACYEYLSINSKEINDMMKKVDLSGKKKYSNRALAIDQWIKEHEYFITN